MTNRKRISAVSHEESETMPFEFIGKEAIKQCAKHPGYVEKINRIARAFLDRAESGEFHDYYDTLTEFNREVERACTRRISYEKSPDRKKRTGGKELRITSGIKGGNARKKNQKEKVDTRKRALYKR